MESRRPSFKESYPKRIQKYLYGDHKPKGVHVVTEQIDNASRLDRWENGDLEELSFLAWLLFNDIVSEEIILP